MQTHDPLLLLSFIDKLIYPAFLGPDIPLVVYDRALP
jgi:hypothetical protein